MEGGVEGGVEGGGGMVVCSAREGGKGRDGPWGREGGQRSRTAFFSEVLSHSNELFLPNCLTKHGHAGCVLPEKSPRVPRHNGDEGGRVLDGQLVPQPPLPLQRRAQSDNLRRGGGGGRGPGSQPVQV